MNFSEQQRTDVDKAILNVRSLSRLLEQKLGADLHQGEKRDSSSTTATANSHINPSGFVSNLSDNEATDLGHITSYTEYLILKYKEKADMKEFLETFLSTISGISGSITTLEDRLVELVISAENAHKQLKDTHSEFTSTVILQKRGQKSLDDFVLESQRDNQKIGHDSQESLFEQQQQEEDNSTTRGCSTIFTNTSRAVYTNEYVTEPSLECSQSS